MSSLLSVRGLTAIALVLILGLAMLQCARRQESPPSAMPYRTYIPIVTIAGMPGGW